MNTPTTPIRRFRTEALVRADALLEPLPVYIGIKASSHARSYLAEFQFDPAVSEERGDASWWLFVRNGEHRVGCFARPQVTMMLADHLLADHLLTTADAVPVTRVR
jgi:hypothetical protein